MLIRKIIGNTNFENDYFDLVCELMFGNEKNDVSTENEILQERGTNRRS